MSNTHHTTYDPADDAVDIRDVEERDGFFAVSSLPISSDQTARDGEAFSTDRLRGFEEQINNDRTVPVFLSHGRSELSEERYGTTGKIGRVANAGIETRDDATLLTADLEIASPDALADEGDTGDVEETLRWVREQFRLGLGSVSVGWSENTGDRDIPGDAELLEVSVVGIESDTEAQQAAAEPTQAAVRGFESLQTKEGAHAARSTSGGMRGWDQTSDRKRVKDALGELERYVSDQRREKTGKAAPMGAYPVASTAEEVVRQLRGTATDTISGRLSTLRRDDSEGEKQREQALARLDTIEEHREGVTRSADTDPVVQAVRKLRRVLTDDAESEADLSVRAWRE